MMNFECIHIKLLELRNIVKKKKKQVSIKFVRNKSSDGYYNRSDISKLKQ